MPHIIIKHFPVSLDEDQQSALVSDVTDAVTKAFGCATGVVSIALEPIRAEDWNEAVYEPEIVYRRSMLRKLPEY